VPELLAVQLDPGMQMRVGIKLSSDWKLDPAESSDFVQSVAVDTVGTDPVELV
jgi:hypothetical protein